MSYDAHRVRSYDRLYDLMAIWEAERILESVWVAELLGPAEIVRDHIRSALDSDDAVAVIELAPDAQWATHLAQERGVIWLQQHIPFRHD